MGTSTLTLDRSSRTVSGTVTLDGVVPTAAHIHAGEAGTAGAIVLPLTVSATQGVSLPATVLSQAQLDSLDAGQLYVNIHGAAQPGGEIRGQIGRRVLLAAATGAQEVASNTSIATGRGFLTFDPTTRRIEGNIALTGMTATLAHIHQAVAGVNGPVAIALTETAAGSGVWSVAANTPLTAVQAQALLADGMYYNAHSEAFTAGEIRGQLELE